jgi:hypothetical protein
VITEGKCKRIDNIGKVVSTFKGTFTALTGQHTRCISVGMFVYAMSEEGAIGKLDLLSQTVTENLNFSALF